MKKYFIYALVCPIENIIKYIGITTNLKARYWQHCNADERYDDLGTHWSKLSKRRNWILQLQRKNKIPDIKILKKFYTSSKKKAYQIERNIITEYLEKGYSLVNSLNLKIKP